MIVAVTAVESDIKADVDPRFGRASFFIIHDTSTGETRDVLYNANLHSSQGAGIQAAEFIAGLGAEALLTGHCGPKAFKVLSAAGITVYPCSRCTVQEALDLFADGVLDPIETADVEGHWA